MVNTITSNIIDLETFLKTAGNSFTDAQKSLVPGHDISTNMILNNADLELKVAVNSDSHGKMSISPISPEDISRGGIDPGLLSTLRISFVSAVGDIKPASVSNSSSLVSGVIVPSLKGILLDKAVHILTSSGWRYEIHAAQSEDLNVAENENHGLVVKQTPVPGQLGDRQKVVIHVWADLGNTPVSDIDGIGSRYRDRLRKIDISTIGELSLASAAQVSTVLRTSEARAQNFIDLASLITRLGILGIKGEVAALIIKTGQVRNLEQLAAIDPAHLYHACCDAVASGLVVIPKGFKLTLNEIAGYIKAAGDYLNDWRN